MTTAKIIELILVTSTAGSGTEDDPLRQVTQLYSKDGKLVADECSALKKEDKTCANMFNAKNL